MYKTVLEIGTVFFITITSQSYNYHIIHKAFTYKELFYDFIR